MEFEFMLSDKWGNWDFKIAPTWTHIARCISFIDLWTQLINFNWELKESHKIRLTFELPEEQVVFKEENWEQPFVVSKEFTASLSEKSKLRPFLESWRGKTFTKEELENFNVWKLVWAPCALWISHVESKWNTYANITTALPLMKWQVCPEQIKPSVFFSLSKIDMETFNKLHQKTQEKIQLSKEWKLLKKDEISIDDIPFN